MIDIFISRPTWTPDEFKEGLAGFLSFLGTHDLKPRTIGSTDYPTESPLDEVIRVMDECYGAIILGYPQIHILLGNIKGLDKKNLLLPTEWNHIEATLAYTKRMPLLIIHHKGISRGIFDHGAISKFIYEKDLSKSNWFLSDNISGALMRWKVLITQRLEEKQFVAKTPPSPPKLTPQKLDESVESVLLHLFVTSDLSKRTIGAICRYFNCAHQAAKYCIDTLLEEKMITRSNIYPLGIGYTITPKGRNYVMKNKLIKL